MISGYCRYIETRYKFSHTTPKVIIKLMNHYYIRLYDRHYQLTTYKLSTNMSMFDFNLKRIISKGGFATTWRVQYKKTKKIHALKLLKIKNLKSTEGKNSLIERPFLHDIGHPFILDLKFIFRTKAKLCVVTEIFDESKSLSFRMGIPHEKLSQETVVFYAAQIFLALESLHSYDIIFGDLQPENILIQQDGYIKIKDIALHQESISESSTDIVRHSVANTQYLAPELLRKDEYINNKVDWWAFGCILYEMICGRTPFYDTDTYKMHHNVLYTSVPLRAEISGVATDIILGLLHKSAAIRIGSDEIRNSTFFSGVDWDALYNKKVSDPSQDQHGDIDSSLEGYSFDDYDYNYPGAWCSPKGKYLMETTKSNNFCHEIQNHQIEPEVYKRGKWCTFEPGRVWEKIY